MLPESVPTPSAAPTNSGDRPQLKIAARAQDVRSEQRESSVVINDELAGWHKEWRRTLESMKATLADLERSCESAIDARDGEVAGLIETLVASARADATAAAEQTREQAQIEITRLEQALSDLESRAGALKSDLATERATVKTLEEQLETDRNTLETLKGQLATDGAARVRAEGERDEARRECERQSSAAELQVHGLRSENDALKNELTVLRHQLEEALAETSKTTATLQVIQQALAQGMPVNMGVQNDKRSSNTASAADARSESGAEIVSVQPSPVAPSVVPDPQAAIAAAHPEVIEDIKRVFEQVESIYTLDLNAGRTGTELVDSLTGSLRYARDLIVARWSRDGFDAAGLFEYHMALLLDTNVATSFGRHLSISAYASRKPAAPAQGESATVEKDR